MTDSIARAADFLWVGVPLAVRRLSAGLATVAADGLYLAVRPTVGLVAPLSGLFAGLIIGGLHPGFDVVFTEALWLLIVISVAGVLSGAVGLYLTIGFAVGDLLIGEHPLWRPEGFGDPAARYGSWLLTYLLFAVLAVWVPVAAKSLAAELMPAAASPRLVRALAGLASMVAATGLLVFVWLQSAAVLIRPVFVWAGRPATEAAVSALREHAVWVVGAAVLAACGRAVIQAVLAAKVGQPGRMTELEDRFRAADRVRPLLGRLPLVPRFLFRAALLTLLLSGLVAAYWQAVLTFVVLFAAQMLASMLSVRALPGYAPLVTGTPSLVRVAIALIPVSLLGWAILDFYLGQATRSFLPLLFLTVVSAVLMCLLNPARPHTGGERA